MLGSAFDGEGVKDAAMMSKMAEAKIMTLNELIAPAHGAPASAPRKLYPSLSQPTPNLPMWIRLTTCCVCCNEWPIGQTLLCWCVNRLEIPVLQ